MAPGVDHHTPQAVALPRQPDYYCQTGTISEGPGRPVVSLKDWLVYETLRTLELVSDHMLTHFEPGILTGVSGLGSPSLSSEDRDGFGVSSGMVS